ncbi:MFS general substrate transporter [Aspergillus brunneoviolaceus CBS 621.78]|uniref:MFS general substrate transporter n=1 Tax=Aspergillus brunneoviolaceus CBS 621.78 TaxID=1450534 RepID=A0ACD1GPL0_9EURO|nr:MFS general substrate transporter [Aspergillus brunneoviolaceus CBS 621.78]RAH51223.1 MFS general substrate transporter [Aspergillus brunneoviolaceus CBS 621.78]
MDHSLSVKHPDYASQVVVQPVEARSNVQDTKYERQLVRRIDLYLMPVVFFSFGLQLLDKTSLAFSAVLGMNEDLNLVGQQYSWSNAVYDVGFLVASYPVSLGFVRFPLGKYLAVFMGFWGIVLTLHAVAVDFKSLMILRAALGVFGSANAAGFSLVTNMWYTDDEQIPRHSFWFTGNVLAGLIGSFVAYGSLQYTGGFPKWKIQIISLGLLTLLWSIVLFFYLPDSPSSAWFLHQEDRQFASSRLSRLQRTTETSKWDWSQVKDALTDFHVWWWFIFSFVIALPNSGATSFSTLIIEGFGYNAGETILIGLPTYAFQLVTIVLVAVVTSKIKNARLLCLAAWYLLAIAGTLMIKLLPAEDKLSRLAGFWLIMSVVPLPLVLSLLACNIAGSTKKPTVLAVFFIANSAGNLVGPQCFIAREAPHYTTAFTTLLTCYSLAALLCVVLRCYLVWQNKRRDIQPGEADAAAHSPDISADAVEKTERTDADFRYVL